MSSIERTTLNSPMQQGTGESLPERYRQPGALTQAGQLDREHERRHVLAVRDEQRRAIEGAARQGRIAFDKVAESQARRQALTELKWDLHRAQKESHMLAGEDPELQAKYAVLDDDYFRAERLSLDDWQ